MVSIRSSLAAVVLLAATIQASPIEPRAGTTPLTTLEEQSYNPAALFAAAAYCPASTTATWACGAKCNAIPGFKTYGSGGDGSATQYWFVGYDATFFKAVVVGHQGTDPSKFESLLVDGDFVLDELDPTLFPGIPTTIKTHNGFQESHARAAPGVLAAVKAALAASGSTKVTIVGHSLGAAIALLDAVYLPLHLPAGTTFTTTVFGLPRTGNPAFASYVDAHVTNFAHITNKKDPIPIVPGRFLGFAHPGNEKHIVTSGTAAGSWVACTGQDNTDPNCSTGAVPNILLSNIGDHGGPYGTVSIGSC